LKNEIY